MSEDVQRRGNGQFAKGQSGNTAGASTRKRKELLTPTNIYKTILRVAGSEKKVMIDNQEKTMTVFEANMWNMAAGKGNRPALKDFVELVKGAAINLEHIERREAEQARRQARNY